MTAKKNLIKRVVKTVAVCIFAFIFLLNLAVFLFKAVDKDNQLNAFPGALLTIESGSMEPKLSVGDLIFVWETPYDELKAGDIITFHHGDTLVTHEVVGIGGQNSVITKGLANEIEDEAVTREKYCAKMLFVLPGCGWLMDYLSSPVLLILSALAIFFAFFGDKIYERIYNAIHKNGESRVGRPGAVRIAACASMLSFLLSTPLTTAAKYAAKIYQFAPLSASAIYFQSNYLSESGNTYTVKNWDGNPYHITLEMRNYANDLLYNDNEVDVDYQFRIEKIKEDGYIDPSKYDIVMTSGGANEFAGAFTVPTEFPGTHNEGNVIEDSEKRYTFVDQISALDPDAELSKKKTVGFDIAVSGAGGTKLEPFQDEEETVQTKVKFRLYAYTSTSEKYFRILWGEFSLEVIDTSISFINEVNINQTSGNKLVSLSLRTGLAVGATTRPVCIKWRTDKMFADEYNATFINIINKMGGVYVKDGEDGFSSLTVNLQAYSFVQLSFLKFDKDALINESETDLDLIVEEVVAS